MAKWIKISVEIEGMEGSPLLPHHQPAEISEEIETGVGRPRGVKVGHKREELAAMGLYKKDDAIGIPKKNIMACLRDQGRLLTYRPRRQLTTGDRTDLPALLRMPQEFFPLTDGSKWVLDKEWNWGRNQQGSSVPVYRPRFDKWSMKISFEFDEDEISEEMIKKLWEGSGVYQGLCDLRPGKGKGYCGMFQVSKWERDSKKK